MNKSWICRNDVSGFKSAVSAYGTSAGSDLDARVAEKERLLKIAYAGANVPSAFVWGEGKSGESETKIMPIVGTYWHQRYPYNKENEPADAPEEQRYLAGCVTIAVSQIMNYHRHPATVSGVPIDWTLTQEKFASTENPEIPKLIRLVNIGVKTENGPFGSSSNIAYARDFFTTERVCRHPLYFRLRVGRRKRDQGEPSGLYARSATGGFGRPCLDLRRVLFLRQSLHNRFVYDFTNTERKFYDHSLQPRTCAYAIDAGKYLLPHELGVEEAVRG